MRDWSSGLAPAATASASTCAAPILITASRTLPTGTAGPLAAELAARSSFRVSA